MNEALRRLVERAAAALKAAGAREVYLFGPAASGSPREESDIDLAVSGLPPEKFFHAMGEAHSLLGCPMDLIDLDEQNLFTEYLKGKGKLLRVA